jgi:hypothetical protein
MLPLLRLPYPMVLPFLKSFLVQAIRRIWQQCAKSDLSAEESAKLTAFRHSTLRKMKLADILSLVMEKNGEERDTVRCWATSDCLLRPAFIIIDQDAQVCEELRALEQRLIGCKRVFDAKRLFSKERKTEILDTLARFSVSMPIRSEVSIVYAFQAAECSDLMGIPDPGRRV